MRPRLLTRLLPALALGALALVSCSQTPTSVPLRSLERSGKLSLLCLDPFFQGEVGYSLEDCQAQRLATKPGGSNAPVRLYALVNQTTRGEVVLLDIPGSLVVDTNEVSPGFNFLQVGAQPVDIVTTPEATATFVATAEVNRPGIYAIPSRDLISRPSLLSWPACSLPGVPGAMTMQIAPHDGFCPGPNYAVDTLQDQGDPAHPHGDLSREQQRPGARKLLVSIPSEGSLLLVDAQALLDRTPGSFEPCPIERRFQLAPSPEDSVQLSGDPTGADECPARPATSDAPVCPVRKPVTVTYPTATTSAPIAFAQADTTLYVADQKAPVIHALDLTDPCAPAALPPLLPSSFDQPWRQVTTRGLAISPFTSDGRRFLYAIDDADGSAMAFDVTPGSGARTPIVRSRPEYFPFSARDRLNLGSPIQDLVFVQQDLVPYDDGNGTKISGLRCDPTGDTPGANYRPSDDLTSGANPARLRGVFALASLSSGQVAVIDVDDYDADCRRYRQPRPDAPIKATLPDWVTGCDNLCSSRDENGTCTACSSSSLASDGASGEGTCRAVVRHEIRSRNFITDNATQGRHLPSYSFPVLSLAGVSLPTTSDADSEEAGKTPKLLGPLNTEPPPPEAPQDSGKWVINDGVTDIARGDPTPQTADKNFLVPDIHEPRVALNQNWNVTYEGILPGTAGKVGRLLFTNRTGDPDFQASLYDPSGGFCYVGAHDTALASLEGIRFYGGRSRLEQLNPSDPLEPVRRFGQEHADWLEVTNELLLEDDPYWAAQGKSCDYLRCRATFGTAEVPTTARSFRIRELYNDRMLLGEPGQSITLPDPTGGEPINPECCFPTLTSYRVRSGASWVAVGSVSGFLHDSTLAPDGHCALLGTDSSGELCDAAFATRRGRIYEVPTVGGQRDALPRQFNDPYTFHNPYMYFLIYAGSLPSLRDMTFSWQMGGGFIPLEISLGRGSVQVAPQSMIYHPALGTEVLVTDGALQGVLSIDLFTLSIVRNFL